MIRKTILPAFVLFAIGISFSACKKLVHQNIKAANNSSVAINRFNDVFKQLNAAVDSSLDAKTNSTWLMNGTLCTTVSLDPVGPTFPKTLMVDYGAGCIGSDGVSRSGKIIAEFDGNFESENTTVQVYFEDYTSGQYRFTGTDSITNLGADGDGNPVFSEVIRDASIALGSEEILWEADLNRTWLEGDTTNFTTDTTGGTLGLTGLNDDVFSLHGTASGNDANTQPFGLEITLSLILPSECSYITTGMLVVSPVNFNSGTVDYGTGNCDRQATMEVEGEVFNFTQ